MEQLSLLFWFCFSRRPQPATATDDDSPAPQWDGMGWERAGLLMALFVYLF